MDTKSIDTVTATEWDKVTTEWHGAYLVEHVQPKVTNEESQGPKYDAGKTRWRMMPWTTLAFVMDILEYGAAKYDEESWKQVPNAKERYKDALLRHVIAFASGEWLDVESGKPHLAHAATNCLFLLWFHGYGR
jgi:hypothetical protein